MLRGRLEQDEPSKLQDGESIPEVKSQMITAVIDGMRYYADLATAAQQTWQAMQEGDKVAVSKQLDISYLLPALLLREYGLLSWENDHYGFRFPAALGIAQRWGKGFSPEEWQEYQSLIQVFRQADLIHYVDLWRMAGFLSTPSSQVQQLHVGTLDKALAFHVVGDNSGGDELNLKQLYPRELAVIASHPQTMARVRELSADLQADRDADIEMSTLVKSIQDEMPPWETQAMQKRMATQQAEKHDITLRAQQGRPIDVLRRCPGQYNLITIPYFSYNELGTPAELAEQLQRLAHPVQGAAVILSMAEDINNFHWLDQVRFLLSLRDMAQERGWRVVRCHSNMVNNQGKTMVSAFPDRGEQPNDSALPWQLVGKNGRRTDFSDAMFLEWLRGNQSTLLTGDRLPLTFGANLILHFIIPPQSFLPVSPKPRR